MNLTSSLYKGEKVTELPLKLHPNQQLIDECKARFIVIMAGRKFGKTTLAIWRLLSRAGIRDSICWLVAPSYMQAKTIAWRELLKILPSEYILRRNEAELTVRLKNESIISLKGSDNENGLRGSRLDYVVMDECQDQKEYVWEQILRPNLLPTKGHALFIGTPRGRNWFWKMWEEARAKKDGWEAFHFTTFDNPLVSKEEIELARGGASETTWRQEYMAEADATSGIVYTMFGNDHVISPFIPPPGSSVYRSIDWGLHNATCCLWATEDKDGSLIIFQEHYQSGWSVPRQAKEINRLSKGMNIAWTIIDPSACKRDPVTFQSVQLAFAKDGIRAMPGDNRVEYGLEVCSRYFERNKIKIAENCKNLIRELKILEWRHTNIGLKEDQRRVDDDAADSFRYLVTRFAAHNPIRDVIQPVESVGQNLNWRLPSARIYENEKYLCDWDANTGYLSA